MNFETLGIHLHLIIFKLNQSLYFFKVYIMYSWFLLVSVVPFYQIVSFFPSSIIHTVIFVDTVLALYLIIPVFLNSFCRDAFKLSAIIDYIDLVHPGEGVN